MEGSWVLDEVREWIAQNVAKGVECPACYRFAKVYRRKINSGMVRAAVWFYRNAAQGEWVNIGALSEKDRLDLHHWEYSKLRYWGLLEETKSDQPKNSATYWRLTPAGRAFVEGGAAVQKYAYVYDGEVAPWPSTEPVELITIDEAVTDHFDLEELMGNR
jgi:hypothetical protein